ncbi:MAG: M28 family peptidase [Bacteroidetes bacterium]|nr:MAG: M28 family peptidase [Bacteroidota bacterium]
MDQNLKIHLLAVLLLLSCFGISQENIVVMPGSLREHLHNLTKTPQFRNYKHVKQLDRTADYILQEFSKWADSVYEQSYLVHGERYRNVIATFGPRDAERIIVGAHYDVCGDQEGADDNASGVTGLLELARLFQGKNLSKRVDLVAYTLEEPPFFRTEQMGSYVHAHDLYERNIPVKGMVVLEMIGYFKDEKKTQDYPLRMLKGIYGSRGNYITLVRKLNGDAFERRFFRKFKKQKKIRTKRFIAPATLTGVDFSDHLNYWKFGFPALMITDTAFYRNKSYHKDSDQLENLDLERMAKVIEACFLTLFQIAK